MLYQQRAVCRTATILLVLLAGFAFRCQTASAQAYDDVGLFQETINSDFFGVDARAMSMGNTGVVSARDGSGIIYNPANLARVRRIEFRGGLSHLRTKNETTYDAGGAHERNDGLDLRKTRINAVSLTIPVPTYRGSLVFGFGVHRVGSYDRARALSIDVGDVSPDYYDYTERETEAGGLWKWTAAGAIDISPRLAAGLSLHLLTGKDKFGMTSQLVGLDASQTITELHDIDIDYVGAGADAGLNYSFSPVWTAGLVVSTPTYLSAEEHSVRDLDTAFSNYIWNTEDAISNYALTRPFSFGLGLSGQFERILVVGDMHYTDWSQLDINYDDPSLSEGQDTEFILDNLKEAVSLHVGAEFLFPEQGVTVRAGYFLDPLPIDGKFIDSNRQYFTAGAGFLIDRVMTLDLAYVHGGYKLRDFDPGSYFSDYKVNRIFATFAYRI